MLSKLPFFANVRTPVRAIVFVYLFLGIGVAMAITAALKARRSACRPAPCWHWPLIVMLLDFFPGASPNHRRWLARRTWPSWPGTATGMSGVLDLPFGYRESNFYMAQQACHGRPIAQGVVARQLAPTLADHLNVKDLAAQRRQLRAARIKYILLHHPKGGLFVWDTTSDGDLAGYRKAYQIVSDQPRT